MPMTDTSQGRNLLGFETSPYLLQHRDNPVHWVPWGEAAFARARAENKPVLLSVGYAACHWCHVMAHESFENPAIAAVMNDLFVCIKVDREERPDVDHIYQNALGLLGQPGGWPLTMFLTPDAEPFWGGTYFPPAPRYGRPGFVEVLQGVADTYHREPAKVTRNVEALKDALTQMAENRSGDPGIDPTILNRIAARLVQEVDPVHGGIGQAPKFPQVPIFGLLWRAALRTGRPDLYDAVTRTLTAMSQGGIYDHLGGGFARYSVDDRWLVPHFEKMLYDNAQLMELLTLVWQDSRTPLFAERVHGIADWVLREMVAEGGGFASTLDADSEGEEGLFYIWNVDEIDRLLGGDAALFKRVYDITPAGNFEGASIPNRIGHPDPLSAAEEDTLARCRAVLLAERSTRVRPGWDDKVLADWNGLMIAALAGAGQVFAQPAWIAAARDAFAFVTTTMSTGGRLVHAWRAGQGRGSATLDDYAAMARAALALAEATGDQAYVAQAAAWTGVLDRHYWDGERGGYFFTADDAEGLIVRIKSVHDAATPNGNGTMVEVLARLYALTGEERYRTRADALVAAFAGELGRNFFPLATFLNGLELVTDPLQIVIAGDPDGADTRALARTVLDRALPGRILTIAAPGQALPPGHPAAGKTMTGGAATAYVCRGMTCAAPVTTPAALASSLDAIAEAQA
nr:thioredoxin domain-containing protein [Azospirillum fermentarium]